ncbi:MAG: cephalosporin hydroxylase family protein [Microscillaceae bacterium]|nr:cephalosporin hydroxylase family protein [Microscillaceae bacterium]MDW8459993.1 cephalosporin hydroxylase family protein [Cytophagales bacterium]
MYYDKEFLNRNTENISKLGENEKAWQLTREWFSHVSLFEYSYHFTWLGLPIIQFPQDILALQEIIWQVKPDLIIETGIARGGSLIFSASMLELLGGDGQVLGIDIDIRKHNREAIESHPMAKRITMIEGSSVDEQVVSQVYDFAKGKQKVLVLLDSNHSHNHVLAELKAYTPLVSVGSYCIVYDTVVEDMPADYDWQGRPWGKGNNPKTAVWEFLKENDNFEIDKTFQNKLLITVAPDGYLKRIK